LNDDMTIHKKGRITIKAQMIRKSWENPPEIESPLVDLDARDVVAGAAVMTFVVSLVAIDSPVPRFVARLSFSTRAVRAV
jgi:hypothetical protein